MTGVEEAGIAADLWDVVRSDISDRYNSFCRDKESTGNLLSSFPSLFIQNYRIMKHTNIGGKKGW